MNEITIIGLAGIAGAVVTIWTLIEKVTNKFKSPLDTLTERVDRLEEQADANSTKLIHDHASFENQKEMNTLILKSCSALMKHGADSNHTGELNRLAGEIDELVYRKGGSL